MAVGFLEVAGYSVALYAMDKACKAADIIILGIDTINPKDSSAHIPLTVQVKFKGKTEDVNTAIDVAKEAASRFNKPEEIIVGSIDHAYSGTVKLSKISKVKIKKDGG